MTRYLITLAPEELFFFGSEQTFGDGTNVNYYARSNPFPQQTTLLGMLRKQVLIQADIYKEKVQDYGLEDKAKMAELIGDKSFNVTSRPQSFGRVKGLSPVLLRYRDKQNKDTFFRTTPKDHGLNLTFLKGQAFLGREISGIPCLNDYKAKNALSSSFLSSDETTCICFDSVFKSHVKIGIDKDRAEEDEGKFFKHLFYSMVPDFSFALFADIDIELSSGIVFMGADSSSFFMTVEKNEDRSFESLFCKKPEKTKITLLSDAFVEPSIYDSCTFSITGSSDFRNIMTTSGDYNYKKGKSKSQKYTLLSQGSVLFVKDDKDRADVAGHLDKAKFQQIGYNHYL